MVCAVVGLLVLVAAFYWSSAGLVMVAAVLFGCAWWRREDVARALVGTAVGLLLTGLLLAAASIVVHFVL